jgi:hypothetical protein
MHYNEVFTMKTYLNLGDPGVTDRVDDLLRMDGNTTIDQEKEGDECYGTTSLMITPPPSKPHFHTFSLMTFE